MPPPPLPLLAPEQWYLNPYLPRQGTGNVILAEVWHVQKEREVDKFSDRAQRAAFYSP